MSGKDFESLIHRAFSPFLSPLGFELQPLHLSGRLFRASCAGPRYILLITFEPGDGETTVMLLTKGHEDLRSIDDTERTPRLPDLNARYVGRVTPEGRAANDAFFRSIEVDDPAERKLLKCARDLRLVLPLHLSEVTK
jgi:hypothetical protein